VSALGGIHPMRARKYGCYGALQKALSRDGVEYSGKVATLLLDSFIEGDGKIYRADLEKRGIIKKSDLFNNWRNSIIQKHWLSFEQEGNFSRYRAGAKLIKFVNHEKLKLKEIATTDQLLRSELTSKGYVDSKIKELENRLDEHDKAIRAMIEKFDPPYDDEKKQKYLNVVK